jgi:aryl-alcohol dehydrogenase-like predicted oxidoreductase
MAEANGCTPAQLALAWLLTREGVIPIPGTSSVERLEENAAAARVVLTRAQLDEIDRLSPVGAASGQRYDARAATLLDA